MTLTLNEAALRAALTAALEPHAEAGGEWLREALNRAGSGVHYPRQPNPSSTVDEYPAVQLGHLRGSIDVRPGEGLSFEVGSYEDQDAQGYREAVVLESHPGSPGRRPFLHRAQVDPAFRQAVLSGRAGDG